MVRLLHNDDNSGLVKNEEVKYYTLTAWVLTKIVFYNLLSNQENIVMHGVLLLSWTIAFWKALELIFRSSSLTSCYLSTLWFCVEIFPMGWLLLIFSDILTLTSPTRLLILLLLMSIVLFWRGCNPALALMLSPLRFSFHRSLLMVLLHLLQTHTLSWWTRWLLCPWDNQRTHRRFCLTRKCLGKHVLIFVHHTLLSSLCELFLYSVWVISSHTFWLHSSTSYQGSSLLAIRSSLRNCWHILFGHW